MTLLLHAKVSEYFWASLNFPACPTDRNSLISAHLLQTHGLFDVHLMAMHDIFKWNCNL